MADPLVKLRCQSLRPKLVFNCKLSVSSPASPPQNKRPSEHYRFGPVLLLPEVFFVSWVVFGFGFGFFFQVLAKSEGAAMYFFVED